MKNSDRPAGKPEKASCGSVKKTVEQIFVLHGAYGARAKTRIEELISDLSAADAFEAARIQKIMDLWTSPARGQPMLFGSFPNGLPDGEELCIAVLGYQLNPNGTMKEELIRRLEIALAGARKYPRAYLLCAGGGTAKENASATEAGEMAKLLLSQGIDRGRVIVEDRSMTTAQNAEFSYEKLRERAPSVQKLVLVTSDYHAPTGALLLDAAAILRAEAPGKEKTRVVCCAALKTGLAPLPTFFEAGALLELYGNTKAAYEIYYGKYDLKKLPLIV